MTTDEQYMHRCISLAQLGAGKVAPNPIVGAVLVYKNAIIGEGWHAKYGGPHAEVNCINDVIHKFDNATEILSQSTLYVSLEPCAHFGKTPPCADLISKYRVPKVVIGCRDPFPAVNGKGIEKLQAAGINVHSGILEKECVGLNKRFFTFHKKKRPYIILKWAQTSDRNIASFNKLDGVDNASIQPRLLISNEFSNRLVHKWRSEEAGILVGTNTVLRDDPELTTRLWEGANPVRVVVDMNLRLPSSLRVFNENARTFIFNSQKHGEEGNLLYYQLPANGNLVQQLTSALYELNIQSVLVEGGARLLQSFIDEGTWDEARVITNTNLSLGTGLPAPRLNKGIPSKQIGMNSDTIEIFHASI